MYNFQSFSQYYLVSTIMPGLFNLLLFAGAAKSTNLWDNSVQPQWWEWVFLLLTSVVLTLSIGMRIERLVFRLVRDGRSSLAYEEVRAWRRISYTILVQRCARDDAKFRIKAIENTLSEYYFLNNILGGVVLSALFLCLTVPISKVFSYPHHYVPVYPLGCALVGPVIWHVTMVILIIASAVAFLKLLCWTMRQWLSEYEDWIH